MFRVGASFVLGFVLIVIESFIVMRLKHYSTIYFSSIEQFVGIWAMNFFLVFTKKTDINNWIHDRQNSKMHL
ncbi:hypothetical protein [Calidifontibacillus oryziterrae]|uniref:hypothetical protein n=1 Tax=Calidifontibacillus oryziterrae TaxID=1191699 RepID=UPI0002F6010B|nr:hypothetical protein [Calidifontibacillus oryziterrae]